MSENMEVVAEKIQLAYNNITNINNDILDGISAVKTAIEVLLGEEHSAIKSYDIFLKDIRTKIPNEIFLAIKEQIEEIVNDEKDHINILKTIRANLKDTLPKNKNGMPFTLANNSLEESLALFEDVEESGPEEDVELYMNTWGNYNENGAEAKSIGGGWMSLEDAKSWTQHMSNKGEEPFINDINDNIGLPFEISESADVIETIDNIIDFVDGLTEDEQNTVRAIMDYNGDNDYESAKSIVDSGNYIFYPDVSNETELAEAAIDRAGGLFNEIPADRIENYIDLDDMYDDEECDFREMYANQNGISNIDDIDDDDLKEYGMEILEDELNTAMIDQKDNFFEPYFDYESYGRDLSFDYTITPYGAIMLL